MEALDPERTRARMAARIGRSDTRMVVSPYRVCPLGAHIDHQGGPVLGMAISAHTLLLFAPSTDSRCRIWSENFPGEVRFDMREVGAGEGGLGTPESGWGIYARGVVAALRDELPTRPRGIEACLMGSLPGGGLSSSASVSLAYLTACDLVNDLRLEPRQLAELARRSENESVGVACGLLDPISIVGARRGQLLSIDTEANAWEPVPLGAEAPGYRILVAYTGVPRSLASTGFNQRVDECRAAARSVAERAGLGDVEKLGDLPEPLLDANLDELEPVAQRRARHFRDERNRVRAGVRAWREGDLAAFGELMNESCASSRSNFETGCPELVALQGMLEETAGVFGARFSGAGFGGCAVALVEAGHAEAVRRAIESRFHSAHPELADRAACFLVDSDDGVRIV